MIRRGLDRGESEDSEIQTRSEGRRSIEKSATITFLRTVIRVGQLQSVCVTGQVQEEAFWQYIYKLHICVLWINVN